MLLLVSFLSIGTNGGIMRSAKDAGLAPTFHSELDGSVTAVYPIMEGSYEDMENQRRRLTELTQEEIREKMLDKHNELRSTTALGLAPCACGTLCGSGHQGSGYHPGATNMNKLFWDEALETVAQNYADKCLFIHNSDRSTEAFAYSSLASWSQTQEKYMGENLYISSTGEKVWNNEWAGNDYGIEGGLQGWWDEAVDYQLQETSTCDDQIGHYTQYVRADSRFVGCGVTICSNGISTESTTYTWANLNVVCNYAGGQYGDVPYGIAYTASDVASECEPDRTPNTDTGLCEGPQAIDYFENPQSSYDKSSYPTTAWICDDGTGRDMCDSTAVVTPQPTTSPTAKPTNKPITEVPTSSPVDSTTKHPTRAPITANVVTAAPTMPSEAPTSRPPTRAPSDLPTFRPTASPTTPSPIVDDSGSGSSDSWDCTLSTNINWVSESNKAKRFSQYAWATVKDVLSLESASWSGGYSYQSGWSYQTDEEGDWILNYYIDIDIIWNDMTDSQKEYYTTYMLSEEFEEEIGEGLEDRMTAEGEVSAVTSSSSCSTSTSNAGFASSDSSGSSNLPFSTWNLNSYDFSDWFVLLFILFSGCFLCFGCGFAMHRRRVLKTLEDLSVEQLEDNEDIDDDGGIAMVPSNYSTKVEVNQSVPVHGATASYGDAVMTPNEPEIEIGVSVHQSKMGLLN